MSSNNRGGQVGEIRSLMKEANLIVEVRDARGPAITSPARYLGKSPVTRLVVLTKADLAHPGITKAWIEEPYEDARQVMALDLSGRSRAGDNLLRILNGYVGKVKSALGIVRAVVVGLPNVGKSTLINRVRKASVARVGDQPGVTRGKMWVQVGAKCFVLDTPGIIQISQELMKRAGANAWKLSLLNIVPDSAMNAEDTVEAFLEHVMAEPGLIPDDQFRESVVRAKSPADFLIHFAIQRRLKTHGGDPDIEAAARRIIGMFRKLELGRISLEEPGSETP